MRVLPGGYGRIKTVEVSDEMITAHLADGRIISVPIAWSWRSVSATPAQPPNPAAGVRWMIRVIDVRYVSGYTLWIRFNDGLEGEVDLGPELEGLVFEPLRDPAVFRAFVLHPDLHTVVWPNDADFAPEFLHERVRVPA